MTTTAARLSSHFWHRYWPSFVHLLNDSLIWSLAIPFTIISRLEFSFESLNGPRWGLLICVAILIQAMAGVATGIYRRRWRVGTFDEVMAVALSIGLTGLSLFVLLQVTAWAPRSVPVLSTPLVILAAVTTRSVWRLARQRVLSPSGAERAVVVGAGEAAYRIVIGLLEDPKAAFRPVAMVDDDPAKRSLRWRNVSVAGGLTDLPRVCKSFGSQTVLLAIPSGSDELYRAVDTLCRQHDLRLLVLPKLHQTLAAPSSADLRPVEIDDLLGRPSRKIDVKSSGSYVAGRRVLVTGAGGSIGSELCRQLSQMGPSQLLMLDRDESGLHATQLSIDGRGLLDDPSLILADIRDRERLAEVFEQLQPEVVFHAAALKHLSLLERAPQEGWKTNVIGTRNVLELARENRCERFVNISTDKAADPICVLGHTKRIAELLTARAASEGEWSAVSVRFGNVLGSRGSVLLAFEAQARAGGPLMVTHPDVTRYFMTIEEAVALTIAAGGEGRGGEIMVLDMGMPMKIIDVAKRIAAKHSPVPEIAFTSLRPGEKLEEVLVGASEEYETHPSGIFLVVQPGMKDFDLDIIEASDVTTELLITLSSA